MSDKFTLKVYTWEKGSDYYDMSEDEMKDKCCIHGCQMYFYDSLPEERQMEIDEYTPTLYDVMNYETTAWWTWPQEQLIALYKSNHLSEKFKQDVLEHLSTISPQKLNGSTGNT